MARRSIALLAIYLLAFGALGYRLVHVQVVHAQDYARLGELQRNRTIELLPKRGRIYDRNGDVLATNIDAATIYADPRAYRGEQRADGLIVPPAADAAAVAAALAPVIGKDQAYLEERLRRDAHFVYLARLLPWEAGEEIREMNLPGIGVITEPRRVYPAKELASQIVGFTGVDGDGLSGLEVSYERILAGEPGTLALEQAPGGLTIATGHREIVPPQDGTDLVLTIDREIQHVAQRAAAAAVDEHNAKGAGVAVMDVATGEVLAMASVPTYDPNEPSSSDPERTRLRPVTDMFEPGSIQKAVTAAAAVEEGIAGPNTAFHVGEGLRVGGKTFTDSHKRTPGPMSLAQIVEESSNIGTILLAQQLGSDRLHHYLGEFGYGSPLAVGFPGESAGSVLPLENWSATSLPTISIGYGVAVTLLQAAGIYATLANDGVAVQPRIVRGTVGSDGRLAPAAPGESREVVSEATAETVREMLTAVVDGERGTGQLAAVAGYSVGGKTGTARKPLEGARGYSGEYIASFVGFAPAHEPRLVVAVMVDEPRPIYGGLVAAPVFSEVMGFALGHRRIPPDEAPDG